MRGTNMHLYKTLYTITERPEKVEMSSFVSDLQDLGLRDAFCSTEALRATQCPVYYLSGPDIFNPNSGKKEQVKNPKRLMEAF